MTTIIQEGFMTTSMHCAWLTTHAGPASLQVEIADTFWSRFKGLMWRNALPRGQAMLLKNCDSVHTAWMRFPIDLVYLDAKGQVLGTRQRVMPWRASACSAAERRRGHGSIDTLELASGEVSRMGLRAGMSLNWGAAPAGQEGQVARTAPRTASGAQRGVAMVEFAIAGPILILLGLASVQYGLLYNAKNVINHASFMGARAGSMANARIDTVRTAYVRGLLPLYGGGRNATEIAESLGRASADFATSSRIELLNPTRESFDDWHDPRLQATLQTNGKRVIPNRQLARNLGDRATLESLGDQRNVREVAGSWVKAKSGQSLSDANLLKIRITHGYRPSVPLMGMVYNRFLRWMDTGNDAFATTLLNQGRIPVVSHVTVQMQTDAIEGSNVSSPGMGNDGAPKDPGTPPPTTNQPAPWCTTAGCSQVPRPTDPGGQGNPTPCKAGDCQSCPIPPQDTKLPADILFEFDKATLTESGINALKQVIAEAKSAAQSGTNLDGLKVIGHTDQIGTDAVNDALSKRRADAVAAYLRENGFPGKNITTEGRGSREPEVTMEACSGTTDKALQDCLAPNRRVVLSFPAKS
jgi:outer membrane protein OmpA-like peptidoglycan-associated protein/uncharacterized membrane protein (UPF0127 family)